YGKQRYHGTHPAGDRRDTVPAALVPSPVLPALKRALPHHRKSGGTDRPPPRQIIGADLPIAGVATHRLFPSLHPAWPKAAHDAPGGCPSPRTGSGIQSLDGYKYAG